MQEESWRIQRTTWNMHPTVPGQGIKPRLVVHSATEELLRHLLLLAEDNFAKIIPCVDLLNTPNWVPVSNSFSVNGLLVMVISLVAGEGFRVPNHVTMWWWQLVRW